MSKIEDNLFHLKVKFNVIARTVAEIQTLIKNVAGFRGKLPPKYKMNRLHDYMVDLNKNLPFKDPILESLARDTHKAMQRLAKKFPSREECDPIAPDNLEESLRLEGRYPAPAAKAIAKHLLGLLEKDPKFETRLRDLASRPNELNIYWKVYKDGQEAVADFYSYPDENINTLEDIQKWLHDNDCTPYLECEDGSYVKETRYW
jgi:hypothetical protein